MKEMHPVPEFQQHLLLENLNVGILSNLTELDQNALAQAITTVKRQNIHVQSDLLNSPNSTSTDNLSILLVNSPTFL